MRNYVAAVLLSGAIGLLISGCSSTTPTMRAQSPHGQSGSWSDGPVMNDGCPMCQSSMGMGGGDCQACQTGGRGPGARRKQCPPNCQKPCCNLPFHPVHRNFHTYHAPENNMYPPENSAPAQVQYPYYTFRGPTDFFMK